jgi:hypothetical protein
VRASRAERDSSACKPGSVGARKNCWRRTVISLGMRSPAPSSGLPAASLIAEDCCSPLIRPCSNWGLPCRSRCRERGGLLPHHFTLTPLTRGRSVFCGAIRRPITSGAQVLPGSVSMEPGLSSTQNMYSCIATVRPSNPSPKVARFGRENSHSWSRPPIARCAHRSRVTESCNRRWQAMTRA